MENRIAWMNIYVFGLFFIFQLSILSNYWSHLIENDIEKKKTMDGTSKLYSYSISVVDKIIINRNAQLTLKFKQLFL